MVVKLYSRPYPHGRGGLIALVLNLKQVPFELVDTDSAASKTPEYLEMNPFGFVPVLEDGGVFVYETRAICRYIVDKYPTHGPALVPGPDASAEQRTRFEVAASIEAMNFYPAVRELGAEVLRKPAQGLPRDDALIAKLLVEWGKTMDAYDKILSKQAYLGGDELTLADLFHLMIMPKFRDERAAAAGIDLMGNEKRSNVMRWWKTVTSHPEWVKIQGSEAILGTA
ncbi:hypothetical protein HMN09_01300700 [Mycena chlorophos]|uniref:glutathione transferase n=1 Tax=Mycena chlorophos TaxID=658473 RepID=A0A8H6S1R2_MYCCL|nr:hypothetical protein HMN09_01300700 [Mycena chlorophos]